jgi:hypothetical protein
VPQLVTHKALVEEDKEKALFWAFSFEKTCVKPLANAGLLGGVLLRLSPYFKNECSAFDDLKSVPDAVSHQDFDYAVEFITEASERAYLRNLVQCLFKLGYQFRKQGVTDNEIVVSNDSPSSGRWNFYGCATQWSRWKSDPSKLNRK